MTLPDLTYLRPGGLAEACALGERLGGTAAFIAGGTELIPDLRLERETARHLIALDGVAELHGISVEDGELRIGALVTIGDVARSQDVRARLEALADAARAIGSAQIRSLATIGGNFCRAVACADTPPAAIAGEARLRIAGPRGVREVNAGEFFLGPRRTVLQAGEVLVQIVVPEQPLRSGSSYQRFSRRSGAALAVAAVAARVTFEGPRIAGVRVVLGAVAPIPLLSIRAAAILMGQVPSAAIFAEAATVAAEDALPISDVRGSAEFRRTLVCVLARRALEQAAARAAGVRL